MSYKYHHLILISLNKKRIYTVLLFSGLLLCRVFPLFSENVSDQADSIIINVLKNREIYKKQVRKYDAQVYIKGNTAVNKKNILLRYAPDFLYVDRKGNNSLVEALVDIRYTIPSYFDNEIKVLNGSRLSAKDIQNRVTRFLNMNIYDSTIFDGQILLPDRKDVFKYYRFEYITSTDTLGKTIHQIKIIPKIKAQRLMSGFFYIVDGSWTIQRIDIKGYWELSDFRVQAEFGLHPNDFLLPLNASITFYINLLGNNIETTYFAGFKYKSVEVSNRTETEKPLDYDLSNYFNAGADTISYIKDSLFWDKNRPVSLSPYEESLFESQSPVPEKPDTLVSKEQLWKSMLDLIEPKRFSYNSTQFTYSGFLNPLKFAYSQLDGIVYWQQLKLYKQYGNGREIQFNPNIGLLFQKEEFYFDIPARWLFAPKKFGEAFFTYGNRNQSYNSTIIHKINKEMPGDIDFSDFDLEYYKHYHLELGAGYELANGLLFRGALDYDWYIPVKKESDEKSRLKDEMIANNTLRGDIEALVNTRYSAFVPVFKLQWTPRQYYRINGKRKEYLESAFPVFSIEYARGIKNIFRSNSDYERMEMDVQQKIPVGLMRSVHYYIGAGMFTNTKSVYFSDFENFRRRNIPQSWNDPLGGTFHLLKGDWYNAANSYIQVHFRYESPFVILQLFRRVAKDILKERIYASQLYTPALPCYTEIGYGVGNFLFNAALFASFNKGKYESIGVKLAFELGQ
jgi:hypothetical protein